VNWTYLAQTVKCVIYTFAVLPIVSYIFSKTRAYPTGNGDAINTPVLITLHT
jgi:hypothetical protein